MKKYAYMIWGKPYNYQPEKDCHSFSTPYQTTSIVTVNSFEEAVEKANALIADGYGTLELCGAFGKENADKLIEATGGRAAIGYVHYEPEQKKKVEAYFADFGLAPQDE